MSEHEHSAENALAMLERRGVITTDPAKADLCCGLPRDDDGFCWHRPGHPIYVPASVTSPGGSDA